MRTRRWLRPFVAVGLMSCVVVLAACGGDDASGGSTSTGESATKPKIAFLNPNAANTYARETSKVMQQIAAERGAELTEFDGAYDVAKQQQQLQNVIATKEYDGVIIDPVGAQLATDVEAAAAAGLKPVIVGLVLGPKLDTPDPQVKGVELSVLAPPESLGTRLGEVVVKACENKDPCRVVYIYGVKGTPTDTAYIKGFKEAIAENPAIEIVAYGEGKYEGPDVALAAMQNILQATPEFDVVVGVDQAMQGVQLALEQADKLENVAIVGLGGSQTALERIAAKKWFGGVMTTPKTEGDIAMNGMLNLLDGDLGMPTGIDPVAKVPDNGLITQENVDKFEAQWKG